MIVGALGPSVKFAQLRQGQDDVHPRPLWSCHNQLPVDDFMAPAIIIIGRRKQVRVSKSRVDGLITQVTPLST
jgi:hypothetical protein